jgi:fructose-bisphosphate aldolase, class I
MIHLQDIVQKLFMEGKGILAADESNSSADKRLIQYGIMSGKETKEEGEKIRRTYRDLFLATSTNEKYLSGVILFSETLDQLAQSGTLFPKLLLQKGIIPGIKVDEGLEPFPESPDESITKGLIGLPERLKHFKETYDTGFTKWRAVITIDGTRLPTARAIHENAKRLAMYARNVQEAGMVPMVEPEVLLEGNHSIRRSREVLTQTLTLLMAALEDQAVDMGAVILKTSMALSGNKSGHSDSPEEIAEHTLGALMETVHTDIAGVVFLSGGQSTEQATENLRAITKLAKEKNAPWPLTFSYARALQDEALTSWAGKDENLPHAREVFLERLGKVSSTLSA